MEKDIHPSVRLYRNRHKSGEMYKECGGGGQGSMRTHPRGFLLNVGIFVPSQSFKTVGGRECDFFLL